MNYVKKSLRVSLIDAIVVSIFAAFFVRFPEEDIVVFGFFFFPLFLLFFISSLFITKSSKKEPISVFLYPFLKTDVATLKIPFILSLIACTVLFGLLLLLLIDILPFGDDITLGTIIFSISFLIIMRIGLIFIRRPETSTRGGIILLTIGIIGMPVFMVFLEAVARFFGPLYLTPLPLLVITIIGWLGIREGEKYYANEILKIEGETGKIRHSNAPFIIPIISFILAVVSAIISVLAFTVFRVALWGYLASFLYFCIVVPLSIISTILNIISIFKTRREADSKRKLIIIAWCLIVFSVGSPFLIFFLEHLLLL